MRFYKQILLASTFLITSTTFSYADIKVVASIKPIHSLVSAISEGIGEPTLLVKGAGSPHTYSLETFASKRIAGSRCYFLDGPRPRGFLENSINNIAANALTISLIEIDKLTKLNFREVDHLMTMDMTNMTTMDMTNMTTMDMTNMTIMIIMM